MCQKRMIEYGNIVSFISFVGRVNLHRVQTLRDYSFSERGCTISVPVGSSPEWQPVLFIKFGTAHAH